MTDDDQDKRIGDALTEVVAAFLDAGTTEIYVQVAFCHPRSPGIILGQEAVFAETDKRATLLAAAAAGMAGEFAGIEMAVPFPAQANMSTRLVVDNDE